MFLQVRAMRSAVIFTITFVMSCAIVTHAQEKEKKALPQGTPILWREPADLAQRNLLLGPGGERMKPDLSRITFIKEEKGRSEEHTSELQSRLHLVCRL